MLGATRAIAVRMPRHNLALCPLVVIPPSENLVSRPMRRFPTWARYQLLTTSRYQSIGYANRTHHPILAEVGDASPQPSNSKRLSMEGFNASANLGQGKGWSALLDEEEEPTQPPPGAEKWPNRAAGSPPSAFGETDASHRRQLRKTATEADPPGKTSAHTEARYRKNGHRDAFWTGKSI